MTAIDVDLWKVQGIVDKEKCFNVWTLRITPDGRVPDDWVGEYHPRDVIVDMFNALPPAKFPKILVCQEMKKKIPHFHVRLCCVGWSTRKSLADFVTSYFPDQKGNSLYSTKRVYVAGKSFSCLVKSITYVSKEGDVIYSRGYPDEELDLFHLVGSRWKDLKSLPIYKKIIHIYNIDDATLGKKVVTNILEYYDKEHKDIPSWKCIERLLFLIKYHVDSDFRVSYLNRNAYHYDEFLLQNCCNV